MTGSSSATTEFPSQNRVDLGWGLSAQRADVEHYLIGGAWKIIDEHTEVESGKNSDRPALDKALAAARLHRAALVVSKVDRLTRSVAFLSRLLEAGVDVRFADLPQIEGATGKFMLQQMVSVAELEAGMISKRTKDALAQARKRGVKLGGRRRKIIGEHANGKPIYGDVVHGSPSALAKAVAVVQQRADRRRGGYRPNHSQATGGRRYVTEGHSSGPQHSRHSNSAWQRHLVGRAGVPRA